MSEGSALLDAGKASAASPKLRLVNILTLGLEAKALETYSGQAPLSFHLAHHGALWNPLRDALVCLLAVTVKIRHEPRPNEPVDLCEISVRLRVEYEFLPEFSRESDEVLLNDYVGIVGRLHAWPYFRSEVQQLTAKLGFPPLTLPVLLAGNMVGLKTSRFVEPETEPTRVEHRAASVPTKRVHSRKKKARG